MKSSGIAAQSRPQEVTQRPASKAIIVWTSVMAVAAVVTVQLRTVYWLNGVIRSEVSGVRSEIGDLRSDMREGFRILEAKVDALRSEVNELTERVTRIDVLVEDRLPAAP